MNFAALGKFDLHLHTRYSDGKNTPEEVILAAVARGLDTVGISDHGYTAHDLSYCIKKEAIPAYVAEIAALKEKYAGKIRVLCGIEQDLYSEDFPGLFDYRIGSVHYIKKDGVYLDVDHSAANFAAAVQEHFGGDYYAFCEAYYENVAQVAERTHADVVGHFDLVTKFNEGGKLFDESHPRYVAAWQAAADRLLQTCRVFEINSGAITRGYRTAPYPAPAIREYLTDRGAQWIYSSDAHRAENVGFIG